MITKFTFANIPGFDDVIIEYINHGQKKYDSLYKFINHLADCYISSNHSEDSILFLKNIDSKHFDETFVERLMFYICLNISSTLDTYVYNTDLTNENTEFKQWCDKWQTVYNKHKPISKFNKKYMIPYTNQFLDRLWNPHTEIGRNFMIKHMNKLPWMPK